MSGRCLTLTACVSDGENELILWCDWLADSAKTLHVANQHKVFTEYEPVTSLTIFLCFLFFT